MRLGHCQFCHIETQALRLYNENNQLFEHRPHSMEMHQPMRRIQCVSYIVHHRRIETHSMRLYSGGTNHFIIPRPKNKHFLFEGKAYAFIILLQTRFILVDKQRNHLETIA